jgi:hypothetical protein
MAWISYSLVIFRVENQSILKSTDAGLFTSYYLKIDTYDLAKQDQ